MDMLMGTTMEMGFATEEALMPCHTRLRPIAADLG
jgi:hypothetical protein